jgi:hypothetical protein
MAKKPTTWQNIKGHALTKLGGGVLTGSTIAEILSHMGAFKDGGRVTKRRGCGIAKRGFGRAMRKK